MIISLGRRRFRVDIGHLCFLLALAAWCVWYLLDARSSSTNIQNLLLIQPAVAIALALVLFVAIGTVHAVGDEPPAVTDEAETARIADRREVLRVFGFMALLGAYLILIPLVGLDVGTFAFIAACLLAQGERRVMRLLLVPLLFTVLMVFGFKALLPIPIPTMFG